MKRIWKPAQPVRILSSVSAVGKQEYEGPFGKKFDFHDETDLFGADTWEHAEGNLSHTVFNLLCNKARVKPSEIDLLFSGDLQNQCVASSEGHVAEKIPYFGLYAACSTLCEGLLLASLSLSANPDWERAAVVTTSHNCAAERQFRLPLEYGGQRPPTAQWTATAGGAYLLSKKEGGVRITEGMAGVMKDAGISDASNMGAAMAPAVLETLLSYFGESGKAPTDFDAILTGDLGHEGSAILLELAEEKGLSLRGKHLDCGALLYDRKTQDAHAGGSGCGCSASLHSAHFLPKLESGAYKRILFMATGALMSTGSIQQGGHIIGIAPLIALESAN